MKWLRRIVIGLIVVYLGVCGVMFAVQRQLQYIPDPRVVAPAAVGLPNVTTENLRTDDGESIVVWWAPPTDAARPTYLYMQGNSVYMGARAPRFRLMLADGAGLMAVAWRGFSGSTGSPTEQGLMIDARTAYRALAQRVDPRRIVFVGESIGTGIATMLAAEVSPAAMVLDSSFMSVLEIARDTYPILPVDLLLLDRFRADLAAPRVTAPVLQIHCRDDWVTPLPSAERLNALFPAHRPIMVIDQTCHTVNWALVDERVRRFVATVMAAR